MTTSENNANRQIARAAGTVMFAILFGQLAGLASKILIADAFPATELDAFFTANRVSETLFTLIAAGALGSAFLPTFITRTERTIVGMEACVSIDQSRYIGSQRCCLALLHICTSNRPLLVGSWAFSEC